MDFYQTGLSTSQPMVGMSLHSMAHYPNPQFVMVVNNCSAVCFSMLDHVSGMPNRDRQIKLLHDCARICASQVIYTVMNSEFDKQHAAFCAVVCETCGNECARFPDQMSQNCARVCLHCAEMCRRYSRF